MNKNKNKKQNRKPPILCMYACIYVYKINIRVKKFYGTALGLRNPRQSSILDNSKKKKSEHLHWDERRSGTSNCGQAREWAVSTLKKREKVVSDYNGGGRRRISLTEISTSASENEAGYLM